MSSQLILSGQNGSFEQVLHRNTATAGVGVSAMLKKDHAAQKAATDDYFRHWDNKTAQVETESDRETRKEEYASLTRQYYNLATDFYEYGFGQSFHFCRAGAGESLKQGIARHEHYLAKEIGIKRGMRVLDAGCGVGGPARQIAKFTGCHVTGITINEYQVERATRYAKMEGLSDQLSFVLGDFMNIPFEDNTFDAVYAIEATVHAPELRDVYAELLRVLKPGGIFGVYEWVMTDKYDNDNVDQRKTRIEIEQGDGIANIVGAADAVKAIQDAGFELLHHEDLADRPDPSPWYWPLDPSSWRHVQTLGDMPYTFRMTAVGQLVTHYFLSIAETLRLAPPGVTKMSGSLRLAATALVRGGKEKIFTPMYFMVGRKPLKK
ncbi:hypothetical protein GQ53DRAFT_721710 [Thozetella sp. PMI_491]|nr:hypothetical protein GQ53DRAFT_721710 [Thozetella sp. PMI_491]